jgi:hypothetical protein
MIILIDTDDYDCIGKMENISTKDLIKELKERDTDYVLVPKKYKYVLEDLRCELQFLGKTHHIVRTNELLKEFI